MTPTLRPGRWVVLAALVLAGPGPAAEVTPTRLGLADALALAGVQNPTIARAVEAVRAAQAELLGARVLLLPTLNAGASFNAHRGNLLSSGGIIRDVNRESVYTGAGARAVGAGTVTVPGIWLSADLGDAAFAPRIARDQLDARRFDSDATRNAILLDVAQRYLALAGAEARVLALRQSGVDAAEVVRRTAAFALAGVGRPADADRARAEQLLLKADEERAEGEIGVASAGLARLVALDPAVPLRVAETTFPLWQLVDPALGLDVLLAIASEYRPEVWARSADVALARARVRQERVRPLLPVITVGYSAGGFGGGSDRTDPRFGRFDGRTDLDVAAYWSADNLGMGNHAARRQREAELGQAEAEQARVLNEVRRQVAEAHARSADFRRQFDLALRRADSARQAYRLDLERIKNLEGRPIEVLNSLSLLNAARLDLVRSLIGHNQAQVALFVALGQPPDLAPGLAIHP